MMRRCNRCERKLTQYHVTYTTAVDPRSSIHSSESQAVPHPNPHPTRLLHELSPREGLGIDPHELRPRLPLAVRVLPHKRPRPGDAHDRPGPAPRERLVHDAAHGLPPQRQADQHRHARGIAQQKLPGAVERVDPRRQLPPVCLAHHRGKGREEARH